MNSFFFDRIRSSADNKKELVVQGYAIDGYLEGIKPRAAIFISGKPVCSLKCRMEEVKLPPIQMRRRHGETISYLAIIYIEFESVSLKKFREYGDRGKLVVVGEHEDKSRDMLYKGSLVKVLRKIKTYNFSVDLSYPEDGKTCIKGWLAGSESTVVKIEDVKSPPEYLNYNISFSPRDDVLMEYPECPDEAKLGFDITLEGKYKKLKITMSENGKKSASVFSIGKSDDEFARSNVISRYSEKIVRNLKNYGLRETLSKVRVRLSPSYVNLNKNYNKWIKKISPDSSDLAEQRKLQKDFRFRPLLSILVPLYETDEVFLDELIKSIQAQTYPKWEICFSDGSKDSARLKEIVGRYTKKDKRVRYTDALPGPLGISSNTNQAFDIAKGDFIVLGDHDDLITPDAFYECVKAMNENLTGSGDPCDTELDVIYTDEDKVNSKGKRRFEPNIKPDFNQELLESCNYITHMFVARKSLVEEVGLFDDTYNGAQDYDFILRCTEKARKIHHVTKIVYSWRINDTSTAGNPVAKMYAYDAGVKALQAHYDRLGINAVAEIGDHLGYYHSKYPLDETAKVYVAVVNADDDELYNKTVESIKTKSIFKNLEYVRIRSNGKASLASQMNNAVGKIREDAPENSYIMFIECGITMMGEDGISDMLAYIQNRPEVGAIGAKLYCTDGTVGHSGLILDMGSVLGWMYTRHSIYDEMYHNYSAYSALRRGIVLFRLSDILEQGSFDEDYQGNHALIDYTYTMTEKGKKCIYDANSCFMYKPRRGTTAGDCFESQSMNMKEFRILLSKHPELAREGDRYYSNSVRKVEKKER